MYLTYTAKETHAILSTGFDRSPMFTGRIKGSGPRYCPSIEDKIVRFADKESHQIFLEPEGYTTNVVYVNGFSTSLPADVQERGLRTIPGLTNVRMIRPGYAVEYDYFPPGQLRLTFETRAVDGLFLAEAFCPQSVTLVLEHDIDVSRGDMIVGLDSLPGASSDLHARVCWMHPRPLQRGKKYFLKHTSQTVQAAVTSLENRINIQTCDAESSPAALGMNDIGEIKLHTAKPIIFDGYSTNRLTGSFILIEPGSNATVAAGMLWPPTEPVHPEYTDFAI